MRKVHDIWTARLNRSVKVSFIQHGNEEEGYVYEVICPFCARTVGHVDDTDDAHNNQTLAHAMKALMSPHIPFCQFPGASTLAVEVTTEPLKTTKLPTL